ncbi:hypothetical protein GCM10010272_37690 [Streptomyces lateritius]|nr:hypothetical protein GCM10010272_37690 [Streptomyces lateritius]
MGDGRRHPLPRGELVPSGEERGDGAPVPRSSALCAPRVVTALSGLLHRHGAHFPISQLAGDYRELCRIETCPTCFERPARE